MACVRHTETHAMHEIQSCSLMGPICRYNLFGLHGRDPHLFLHLWHFASVSQGRLAPSGTIDKPEQGIPLCMRRLQCTNPNQVRPSYRVLLAEPTPLLWPDITSGLLRFLPPQQSFPAPIQSESADHRSADAFLSLAVFGKLWILLAPFYEMDQILNDFCIV